MIFQLLVGMLMGAGTRSLKTDILVGGKKIKASNTYISIF